MRNTLETKLGIFFALAVIAFVLVMELSDSFDFFAKSYPLKARFENARELKKGDLVKMAGIEIGRVDEMELSDGGVEVTMRIHQKYTVKTDSVATIKFTGLMGSNFVSLSFGSEAAPAADPGTILETVEQPDFADVMRKLEGVATGVQDLTRSFSGDNFTELLAPLTDFMKQNGPKVGDMISNVEAISRQISEGEGTVGRLIYTEDLYDNMLTTITNINQEMDGTAEEVKLAIADARDVMGGIREGKGTLGLLAQDETLYKETAQAMTHLRDIFQKIDMGEGTIGELINDETFFKNLKLTLQKLERATENLEDTGPLQAIGTAARTLF